MAGAPNDGVGTCDACHRTFGYRLVHSGVNQTIYAYCASCGLTALLDTFSSRPEAALLRSEGRIPPEILPSLRSCPCSGRFDATSGPRCPHCRHELSAGAAAHWIEADAAANSPRRHRWLSSLDPVWRWQRDWDGLYAIVIDGRWVENPWA
jgi:hypothetical protein